MRAHTRTAEDTEDFGRQLACTRPEGALPFTVLYLAGELGAGKTTFARGFLRALGVAGAVRSPTYTLLEVYPVADLTLVHLDLYRLHEPAELDSLGLRDWAALGHVWLIEWPEKGGSRLPPPDLRLAFTVGLDGHDIAINAPTTAGRTWLARLADAKPAGGGQAG